jgi:acyl-coenzyme A synthetase/AMP-(fatty) acid ligase
MTVVQKQHTATFIASDANLKLLCTLLAEYKLGHANQPTLAGLRKELGDTEYKRFESDMVWLMTKRMRRTAVSAVSEIISEAVARKRKAMQLKPLTPAF